MGDNIEQITYFAAPGTVVGHPIVVDRIIEMVTRLTGIRMEEMCSTSRVKSRTYARHLSWHFIRRHTKLSLKEIAIMFGRSDHTTIIRGLKRLDDLSETEPHVAADILKINNFLYQ